MARPTAAFPSLGATLLAAALALSGIGEAYGQTTTPGGGGGPTGGGTAVGSSSTGGGVGGGTARPEKYLTDSIVKNIRAATAECAGYEPVYRIDCLRQRLLDIARRIPHGPAYAEARQIVAQAASQLGRIQASAKDHKAPRQRSRRNSRMAETKTYTAIKRQNLDKAMAQARQVITEAETRLLRASENSEKRASHYRQIAAAIGSTKVLLRSA